MTIIDALVYLTIAVSINTGAIIVLIFNKK